MQLTRCMAMDYGRLGIRANCICPGFIDTPLLRSVMDNEGMAAHRDLVREQHKLGRFGEPEEIAKLALFLASDESSYSTGSEFVADGGLMA